MKSFQKINKKILLLIGFFVVLFGTAFIQFRNTIPEKKIIQVQTISATQIITIEGKKVHSVVRINAGSTALQLLIATEHKVSMKGEKENAFITAINGRVADAAKHEFWAFYVNGKQAVVGAGTYRVKNNDTIEWKIETY